MDMMEIRRRVLSSNNGIPFSFEEKEYIKALSLGSYFDTGKIIEKGSVISITFYAEVVNTSVAGPCLFGWRTQSSTNKHIMLLSRTSDNSGRIVIGVAGSSTGQLHAYTNNVKTTVTIDTNTKNIYVDGTVVNGLTCNFDNAFDQFGSSVIAPTLLAMSELSGSTINRTNSAIGSKIYNYKVTKNGKSLIDLRPCIRKSDNTVGMFDIINRRFMTGTGSYETN